MQSLNGQKVVITGATGFIGANLVRMCLKAGAEVYALIRINSNRWRIADVLKNVNIYDIDILNYKKIKTAISEICPDIIYHAAAYGGAPQEDDLGRIIQTNFLGTINLVNACKKTKFELFVNTGSSSEYGPKTDPMREDDCPEPINNYGVSKTAATLYCQASARNENLPIVTLRLFSPYGDYEGPSRLIPSVIVACLTGESPRISDPRFVRDFIYVDDVLNSYASLIGAEDVCGEIFNIGRGEQHSVGEVANKIIELTGNKVELLTGMEMRWRNEPANWQADISKAKHLLSFHPQYDLEHGLESSIKWFKKNIDLYDL